jgi:quinol monooxygenase YgiN
MHEPGCAQFAAFESALNPDKPALLALWQNQVARDAPAKLNATRAPLPEGLRRGPREREDHEYNRPRQLGFPIG